MNWNTSGRSSDVVTVMEVGGISPPSQSNESSRFDEQIKARYEGMSGGLLVLDGERSG